MDRRPRGAGFVFWRRALALTGGFIYIHDLFFAVWAMHLVHNERTKLTAVWINTLATGLITAGAFAPVIAILLGVGGLPADAGRVIALTVTCVASGVAIHLGARLTLRGLRE